MRGGKRERGGGSRRQALDVSNLGSAWRREVTTEPESRAALPEPAGTAAACESKPATSPAAVNPLVGLFSAYADDEDEEGSGDDAGNEGKASGDRANGHGAAAAATVVGSSVVVWTRVADPASGDSYFWNAATGEVRWDLPEQPDPVHEPAGAEKVAVEGEAAHAQELVVQDGVLEAPAAKDAVEGEGEMPGGEEGDDDDIAAVLALARRRAADLERKKREQAEAASAPRGGGGAAGDFAQPSVRPSEAIEATAMAAEEAGEEKEGEEEEGELRACGAPPVEPRSEEHAARAPAPGSRPLSSAPALQGQLPPDPSPAHAPRAGSGSVDAQAGVQQLAHGGATAAAVAALAAHVEQPPCAAQLALLASELLTKLTVLSLTPPTDSEQVAWLRASLSTRLDDWRAGALAERHFGARLGEACAQLEGLEAACLPAGWTRAWDGAQGRYYFAQPHTGTAFWQLPSVVAAQADEPPPPPPPDDEPPPPPPPLPPMAVAEARAPPPTIKKQSAPAAGAPVPSGASEADAGRATVSASRRAAAAPRHARPAAGAEAAPPPKKAAVVGSSSRRQVHGLIHKWEAVRAAEQQEEAEARARAEPPTRAELDAQRQAELREWYLEMAADPSVRATNPNFMPLGHGRIAPDAWRERIAQAKARNESAG